MPRAGSHYNLEPSRGSDKIRTRPAGRLLHVVAVDCATVMGRVPALIQPVDTRVPLLVLHICVKSK